ncbi:catalase [Ilumatobacter nonamiensis]|uniref:catalase n=1 Tax=Ilumatobacter nonamiensis TaxID=467093 RepID=UPI000346B8AE|nr:catalase [Ilumatobacter nonamiensis]
MTTDSTQPSETHQTVADAGTGAALTTQQGVIVADDQNTLTDGERGPQLLEDFVMREKIFHFDHERIPERVVHARGYGAKGVFECSDSMFDVTRAGVFGEAGKTTEVFVRFSTVAGNKGSFDLARDVRGFATKFYTDEGNWDLVANNIPVFFIQDAMKFPDLVHAAKPEPHTGFPQAQTAHDNFWDFVSLMPESTHMLMWIMSDRAIPRSFRFMEGFGVHTFRFVNERDESTYVKFHWKPVAGLQSVMWNEAVKINGADPDFHRRDLWNAIESGDHPQWELGVQLFDDDFADSFDFDVLDSTKLIPEEHVPVRIVGTMTLNQNVDNFFAETEQVAFCTANVVPGIDFTNDPLLQGRNFSYLDTQLKRLGSPNFTHIPVNAPRCPVVHFQQDGHMATQVPEFGRANYEPNSWGDDGGPREDPVAGYRSFPAAESGDKRRVRPESFADHYSQARQFFDSQTEVEQTHLADAFVFELSKVDTMAIQTRMIGGLRNVSEELAREVADGLGLDLPEASDAARPTRTDLEPSPALSILAAPLTSFAGRRIGVLVAPGSDADVLEALGDAATTEGVTLAFVAPKKHGVEDSAGNVLEIAEKIDGGPSVLFDAVAVVVTADQAERLAGDATAKDFVSDAHAHCKFVAYTPEATALFEAAGVSDFDDGYHELNTGSAATGFIEGCRSVRFWDRQQHVDAT